MFIVSLLMRYAKKNNSINLDYIEHFAVQALLSIFSERKIGDLLTLHLRRDSDKIYSRQSKIFRCY